jgi:hypothetical protein
MSERTARELADELIGTCAIAFPAELLSEGELAKFDDLAFECEGCGWWCSTDELNNEHGEQLCDECADNGD